MRADAAPTLCLAGIPADKPLSRAVVPHAADAAAASCDAAVWPWPHSGLPAAAAAAASTTLTKKKKIIQETNTRRKKEKKIIKSGGGGEEKDASK